MSYSYVTQQDFIMSYSLEWDDLILLYDKLHDKNQEAAQLQVAGMEQRPNQTDEVFQDLVLLVLNSFRSKVTIFGDGKTLIGYDKDIFTSTDLPDKIETVTFESGADYHDWSNAYPSNAFQMYFDFRKPELFDYGIKNQPTSNDSKFYVTGSNETWVSGVSATINNFLNARKNKRIYIHTTNFHDFVLWFGLFPLTIFKIVQLMPAILAAIPGTFMAEYMIPIWMIFIMIIIYRGILGYARFCWPHVELITKRDNAKVHRKVWLGIFCSLVAGFIMSVWPSLAFFGF